MGVTLVGARSDQHVPLPVVVENVGVTPCDVMPLAVVPRLIPPWVSLNGGGAGPVEGDPVVGVRPTDPLHFPILRLGDPRVEQSHVIIRVGDR